MGSELRGMRFFSGFYFQAQVAWLTALFVISLLARFMPLWHEYTILQLASELGGKSLKATAG